MKILKTCLLWQAAVVLWTFLLSSNKLKSQGFNYEVAVEYVSFSGSNYQEIVKDDGLGTLSAPHWSESGVRKPVSYRSGSQPMVSATFSVNNCLATPNQSVVITGIGNGFSFPVATVPLASTIVYPATYANQSFTNYKIDFWDSNFVINWKVSFDGGDTWQDAGTSDHTVYVTWKKPKAANLAQGYDWFHTLFKVSCSNAQGVQSVAEDIAQLVFNEYSDRKVFRADGAPLYYYKS